MHKLFSPKDDTNEAFKPQHLALQNHLHIPMSPGNVADLPEPHPGSREYRASTKRTLGPERGELDAEVPHTLVAKRTKLRLKLTWHSLIRRRFTSTHWRTRVSTR